MPTGLWETRVLKGMSDGSPQGIGALAEGWVEGCVYGGGDGELHPCRSHVRCVEAVAMCTAKENTSFVRTTVRAGADGRASCCLVTRHQKLMLDSDLTHLHDDPLSRFKLHSVVAGSRWHVQHSPPINGEAAMWCNAASSAGSCRAPLSFFEDISRNSSSVMQQQ